MAYVRSERLVAAAQRLARDSGISLAELALECRYASQPAFTRAFTRAYENWHSQQNG